MQLSALTQKQQDYFSNNQRIIEPQYVEPLPNIYKPQSNIVLNQRRPTQPEQSIVSIGGTMNSGMSQKVQNTPKLPPIGTILMVDVPDSEFAS